MNFKHSFRVSKAKKNGHSNEINKSTITAGHFNILHSAMWNVRGSREQKDTQGWRSRVQCSQYML